MSKRLAWKFVAQASLLACLAACSVESPERPAPDVPELPALDFHQSFTAGGTGSAEIELQPGVRVLERAETLAALRAESSDGSTLVFDSGNADLHALQAGDILLMKELAARRIVAVDIEGSRVAVLTEPAALGEIIRNGRIVLDVPLRFTAEPPETASSWQQRPRASWSPIQSAQAQSAYEERLRNAEQEGTKDAGKKIARKAAAVLYEGWEATFSATPGEGRLDLQIDLSKSIAGVEAHISGTGYLADFDFDSRIDVDDGLLTRLELGHRKVNGAMNFDWQFGKETPGQETAPARIKFPGAISIPLAQYLYGFPLFLEISGALIVQPAITGGKQFSSGSFRVTYDGTQHFSLKGGKPQSGGSVSGDAADIRTGNLSALAPLGMVVAVAAPRIELTTGMSRILGPAVQDIAKWADKIQETLVKIAYGVPGMERWKNSPLKDYRPGKTLENALKSDAAAYMALVTTSAMTHSGSSVIIPCTRTDIRVRVMVGAAAQALGQTVGAVETEIFNRDFKRIEPPTARLCAELNQ